MVQMHVTHDKRQNIETAVRLVRTAVKRYNPRLVVLPEHFNFLYGKQQWYDEYAEVIPTGETTLVLSNLARDLNIYLVGGSIIERDQRDKTMLYNTTTVFSPTGTLIAKYRKIHLSDMELDTQFKIRETDFIRTGDKLSIFEIDGLKVGLGIGYDMSFAELATLYRKQGVDMLIYPAAYPERLGLLHWEQLNRTRAIDNQVYVLGVSPARNDIDDVVYYGHTMLVDPRGRVIVRGGDVEEILYTELGRID